MLRSLATMIDCNRSSVLILLAQRLFSRHPTDPRATDAIAAGLARHGPGARVGRSSRTAPRDGGHRQRVSESIVLISDLQQGSRLDTLQAATWPPDVRLDVRPVRTAEGNASLQWLPPDESDDPSQLRVRVSNDEQAKNDALQLIWETDTAVTEDTPAKSVQVPPGTFASRNVSRGALGNARLKLVGDAHPFDNVAYLANAAADRKACAVCWGCTRRKGSAVLFSQTN